MSDSEHAGPSAIVVGAGIGGLSAAIALRQNGWRVTVLERTARIADIGAGLSLWPNAVRCLDRLGVGTSVAARAVQTVSRGSVRTDDGRWLRRVRPDDVGVLAVHRADLHRALWDAVPDECRCTGAEVVAVEDGDDAVAVSYQRDGRRRTVTGDLAVLADGINSATRAHLWPDHPEPVFQYGRSGAGSPIRVRTRRSRRA